MALRFATVSPQRAGLQHGEPCHYGPRDTVRAGRAHSRGVVAGGRSTANARPRFGSGSAAGIRKATCSGASCTGRPVPKRSDCVNLDLNRAALEVTALQQSPPRLLILHSVTAGVWDRDLYSNCLDRIYTALSFTGLKIGFVTERQLESGEIPVAPVLFVPGIEHLTDAAAAGLRKFRGRTVFVGRQDLLTHDEYGAAANRTVSADPVWFCPARCARLVCSDHGEAFPVERAP